MHARGEHCALLEHHAPNGMVSDPFRRVLQQHDDFPILSRGQGPGPLTVLHMVGASDLADHDRRAHEWATAVWESWNCEHERVRLTLREAAETR